MDRNDRNKNARKSLLLTDVPPDLRKLLEGAARHKDTSINEEAVGILCAAYNIKHVPNTNGYVAYNRGGSDTLLLRGGASLHKAIGKDARKRGGTLRGVVLEKIALHFGLEPGPITRQPRKPKI